MWENEPKRVVFILWKSKSRDDFDYEGVVLHSSNVLRGLIIARGLNEARYKIATQHEKSIQTHSYDRITIIYCTGGNATVELNSPGFYLEKVEKYGY